MFMCIHDLYVREFVERVCVWLCVVGGGGREKQASQRLMKSTNTKELHFPGVCSSAGSGIY